jgi:hypothetical protein
MATPKLETIGTLWAYLAVDRVDGEGVFAISGPLGMTPCVFGTARLAVKMKPLIDSAARAMGVTVRLVRFTRSNVVEELGARNREAMPHDHRAELFELIRTRSFGRGKIMLPVPVYRPKARLVLLSAFLWVLIGLAVYWCVT